MICCVCRTVGTMSREVVNAACLAIIVLVLFVHCSAALYCFICAHIRPYLATVDKLRAIYDATKGDNIPHMYAIGFHTQPNLLVYSNLLHGTSMAFRTLQTALSILLVSKYSFYLHEYHSSSNSHHP